MLVYQIYIEYLGTNFVGWQKQKNGPSIQETLEKVLSKYFKEKIKITGSGRTDKGVHAKEQSAHFDCDLAIKKKDRFLKSINHFLRKDNVSIFSGNVYAYEEGLEIWSEKLTVTSNDDERTINKIDAQDNVKILRQNLMINGNEALYDPFKNTLTVIGKVNIVQNENIILCDKIIVDLENSSSIMVSDSTKRVEALIISEDSN